MDVRRVVGGVGRTMIAAGVLILLFVAYQLWGTGLAEARHQRRLTDEFRQALSVPAPSPPQPAPAGDDPPVTTGPRPAPEGDAVAIMEIPKLGLEKAVVEGVGLELLKRGPGHYPSTPLPGQPGNAAIAGHRTTYGAPFFRLDELSVGDPIVVTTRQGRFRYEVTEKRVVPPTETSVLEPTDDSRLTLTTCNPRFSAAQRLVVIASLRGDAAEPPPPAEAPPAEAPTDPTPSPPTPAPAPPASLDEAERAGLSGANAANGPAVAWGLAAAAVWLLTWFAGRRWRKWPAYAVGTPVFLVVLFVFFENFSRLLPANF